MDQQGGFNFNQFRTQARGGAWAQRLGIRSPWVYKLSAVLAFLVILLPLLAFALGLLIAGAVFIVSFWVLGWIDQIFGGQSTDRFDEGADDAGQSVRENVRVIDRDA